MRQRPLGKPHTGLLLTAYSSQTKGGTIHSGLGPVTSINNQKNANRHTHRAIRKRQLFKFPGDSGLCRVDQSYPGLWHTQTQALGGRGRKSPGSFTSQSGELALLSGRDFLNNKLERLKTEDMDLCPAYTQTHMCLLTLTYKQSHKFVPPHVHTYKEKL